ncbi:uncharacterized protein LOC112092350 [Morus notabilis]|uniref:uncharacterized protein LOC112092350 n=1 Tax=Morus notabilis TaxID=981085 RepID=UPI000CED475F|nr:uncharacterized protein LOC112092350 [Morus notabilis]
MDAMYAVFQGMATRTQNERPTEDRKQSYFREFRRGHIPTFNSEGGPQEAEYWFDSIVKHLNTMRVPEEYWVEFVVYKLEGQTSTWSKQGDMSVREYESKFNYLSRFMPSLVDSEHLKSLKFDKGLKNSVRRPLVALRIQNFLELVAVATSVEQDNFAYHQSREATGQASVSGRPSALGGPQRSDRRNRNQGHISGEMANAGSSSS